MTLIGFSFVVFEAHIFSDDAQISSRKKIAFFPPTFSLLYLGREQQHSTLMSLPAALCLCFMVLTYDRARVGTPPFLEHSRAKKEKKPKVESIRPQAHKTGFFVFWTLLYSICRQTPRHG